MSANAPCIYCGLSHQKDHMRDACEKKYRSKANEGIRGCACQRLGGWKFCPYCGKALPPRVRSLSEAARTIAALEAEVRRLREGAHES